MTERLKASAKVQEGNTPPEEPSKLLEELNFLIERFQALIFQINRTNSESVVEGRSLTAYLAERDALAKKMSILRSLMAEATPNMSRITRSELRTLSTVNIADLRKQVDDLSKRHREVDTLIQGSNWSLNLIE